jgi:hypothetical protein
MRLLRELYLAYSKRRGITPNGTGTGHSVVGLDLWGREFALAMRAVVD